MCSVVLIPLHHTSEKRNAYRVSLRGAGTLSYRDFGFEAMQVQT